MGTKCPLAASPGDPQGELPRRGKRGWPGPLVSFPSLGKKLAARRRRNSPAKRAIQRPDEGIGPYKKAFYHRPPHPSRLRRATFPPRGRLLRGAPSSAPFGGTFPYPLCRYATSSLPLLAYGHFPLIGGIGPLTRGVGPQGEALERLLPRALKGTAAPLSKKKRRCHPCP